VSGVSTLSLAPFFSLLVPVRPFGTGQAAHIHEEKKRGVPCLSVEEGSERKDVEATDALVIRLLDASLCLLSCWQKRGFRPVLPTIGFEPMTLAV
jgi:hypothetical protein